MTVSLQASLGPLAASWREAIRFTAILKRFRPYLRQQIWPMVLATIASLGFTRHGHGSLRRGVFTGQTRSEPYAGDRHGHHDDQCTRRPTEEGGFLHPGTITGGGTKTERPTLNIQRPSWMFDIGRWTLDVP